MVTVIALLLVVVSTRVYMWMRTLLRRRSLSLSSCLAQLRDKECADDRYRLYSVSEGSDDGHDGGETTRVLGGGGLRRVCSTQKRPAHQKCLQRV